MNETASTYGERLRRIGCIAVIPTYNNAGTIVQVIADVRRYADDVLVVDDGSTDATSELLRGIEGIRTIGYARNRGKGYALRRALEAATEWGFRYALTIDADGQHYADDIPVFLEHAERHPGTLLIGARNLAADNMPSKNTFANRFSNFWFAVETGIRLADTQSGFRLYPLAPLRGIRLLTSRYEFEVEIIVRAAWRGVRVANVPIRVYYAPPDERVSHFRPLKDFTRISILNTFLVLAALLYYYPWRFLRSLTRENIRAFVRDRITRSGENPCRLAAAVGLGVGCGILPIWGYQLVVALVAAHLLRLDKVVAAVCSNVSIPPMIPFILYGSLRIGAWLWGAECSLNLHDISLAAAGEMLGQYVIGSLVLALACGFSVWGVCWAVLSLLKRSSRHE